MLRSVMVPPAATGLPAFLLSAALLASPAGADTASTQYADVIDCQPHLMNCGPVVGTAQLLREQKYVSANVVTTELSADAAYTMWWVVFNNPQACDTPFACGEPDLFDPAVKAAVLWATGTVSTGDATANLVATLAEGPAPVDQPFAGVVHGDRLHDADKAEIHLVLRFHDTIDATALTTFELACGGCYDEQFAVFPAP